MIGCDVGGWRFWLRGLQLMNTCGVTPIRLTSVNGRPVRKVDGRGYRGQWRLRRQRRGRVLPLIGGRGTARHNPNCGIKHVLIDEVNAGTACRSGDLRYYFEALVPPHAICLVPQLRPTELLQVTPRTINTCNDILVTSLVFITFSSQIHKITLRDQGTTAEWGFPPWCLWGFAEGVIARPGGILLVNDGEVI